MSTPRPTLDVSYMNDEINTSHGLARSRKLKRAMPKLTKQERSRIYYIINKYRKLQKKMLEQCYEDEDVIKVKDDPDPYDNSYVFFVATH